MTAREVAALLLGVLYGGILGIIGTLIVQAGRRARDRARWWRGELTAGRLSPNDHRRTR